MSTEAAAFWKSWHGANVRTPKPKRSGIARTTSTRCPVDEGDGPCMREVTARGLCQRHYTKKRRAAGRIAVTRKHRPRQALGRGVCSSCSTIAPLFAVGRHAKCRECIT